jgi:transcriptional regulator with XRE-family HTH domain
LYRAKFIVIKQPQLRRKILALRQEKGLTQEKLVEQCNIFARTIRRIEAGEAKPRSYAVHSILDAPDYDLSALKNEEHPAKTDIRKLLLSDVEDSKKANYLTKQLKIGFIAGIVFFLITITEMYADFKIISDNAYMFNTTFYVVLKVMVLASSVFFYRGLIFVGKLFQNYLLTISTLLVLVLSVVFYLVDIVAAHTGTFDYAFIIVTESICFPLTGVFFGIALVCLRGSLKTLGLVAGILEITAAATFLAMRLGIIGVVAWSVAIVVEVVLLYRATGVLKEKIKAFEL